MCGIVAVLADRPSRAPAPLGRVLALLEAALGALQGPPSPEVLDRAARSAEEADALLRGPGGVLTLVGEPGAAARVEERAAALQARVSELERALDTGEVGVEGGRLEALNAALVRLKDAAWALHRDRVRTARAVAELAGAGAGEAALQAWWAVQVALSALDRLEVRGRDSAGLHVLVEGHGLDLEEPGVRDALQARADPLFGSGAVRAPCGNLAFVYKVAAEVGELGDNTRALRAAVRDDGLLRRALQAPTARVCVLGHTRWASVGLISEPNAHPLASEEEGEASGPWFVAALNGDIDNHLELRRAEGLRIPPQITTDAKLIPVLLSRRRASGLGLVETFLATVARFQGSVAIAAQGAEAPGTLLLGLRGSGQALYVGLAPDAFVVASEPYGLVEETPRFLRMDGETPGPGGVPGQVVVLEREGAGTLGGVRRFAYDGTELPVAPQEVQRAEITTRDIDRGGAPHFLLKEILESPQSVRKTLRGRVVEREGRLAVSLPPEALPAAVGEGLASGRIRRIAVIGQGTAARAGQGVAAALTELLARAPIQVSALPATELSGFGMADDMSDTLVIAISQSGTTTDTNRTVDLARAHGASVIAIVNRRNSDLVVKSHGVLYTSDGRDVEMAVPSTKAFYAQVAAGILLALAIAEAAGCGDPHRAHELLAALRSLPEAMEEVLGQRDRIAAIARQHAPPRRYWAVVGNGPNRVAAEELRIKLSELCYKSISCDATEDKKHIDLASEPLILVCAAGLTGATADDVAKEVAIYRAHKAAPIVIATAGQTGFEAALEVIEVPPTHPSLAYVLAAMAGHLFGYEAAVAIDAQARPLREARAVVEGAVAAGGCDEELLERVAPLLRAPASRFFADLRDGRYDGHLEASTAVRLASLLRYATGALPLEAYEQEHGRMASPSAILSDLLAVLGQAIGELTRPIDAIKHQAKTVTVGITRSEEAYFQAALVREVLRAGAPRDRLSYRALRTLAELEPAVAEVTGYTRYRIEGDPRWGATIHVLDRGGIALGIPSRTERDPVLRGTKRRVAAEREVTVARGRADGRTVVLVPEVKDDQVTGLTLLHVRFHDRLPPDTARRVLSGYRGRYQALVDAVTEAVPAFQDARLAEVPVADLLVEPVNVLANRWLQP